MNKLIFIVNGSGGVGKDTFAEFLDEFVPVFKYSSVTKVKDIAKECGWTGGKTEKDRKFLSDLKLLTAAYSDMPFTDVTKAVDRFRRHMPHKHVMLIDIREPAEIERAKRTFGARTILIQSNRVAPITSNMADANVNKYEYDFVFGNHGSLEDFRELVEQFANEYILVKEND